MEGMNFDDFAKEYDASVGETGGYVREHTIDPMMWKCIGDVKGKVVYDVATGNGYMARQFVSRGAKKVYASDVSSALLAIATKQYDPMGITYLEGDASSSLGIAEDSIDLIVMNMAVFYIEDLHALFTTFSSLLSDGGYVVMSIDHILKNVAYEDVGMSTYKHDTYHHYLQERCVQMKNHWKPGEVLPRMMRPLSQYINDAARHGLLLDHMEEAPTDIMLGGEQVQTPIPSKMVLRFRKV